MIIISILFDVYMLKWRDGLARSAVNREVGGSSPPRNNPLFFLYIYKNIYYKNYKIDYTLNVEI